MVCGSASVHQRRSPIQICRGMGLAGSMSVMPVPFTSRATRGEALPFMLLTQHTSSIPQFRSQVDRLHPEVRRLGCCRCCVEHLSEASHAIEVLERIACVDSQMIAYLST